MRRGELGLNRLLCFQVGRIYVRYNNNYKFSLVSEGENIYYDRLINNCQVGRIYVRYNGE